MWSRLAILAATAIALTGTVRADVDFEADIVPLLAKRCVECHNDADLTGGLSLTSLSATRHGGDSGDVLTAGDAAGSLLFQRVADGEMPPESRGQSQRLPDEEIALLKRWIDEGAEWPAERVLSLYERTTDVRGGLDWWSLQPIVRPDVPTLPDEAGVRNPIDAFVRAKLMEPETNGHLPGGRVRSEADGPASADLGLPVGQTRPPQNASCNWFMEPAPEADRRTLVRRLYFDVLGLPPTPEQVAAFVADDSPQAYETLVDTLLESPHFGERWTRYWLDLVRFAETCGYERDQLKPDIWRYRDWVIDAFNDDMPFDRFVTHQLAGDEIEGRDEQSVVATGMLRAGTWNDEPNDAADYVYERLEDMVHTTTSALLGLTVKCARCHDHKFDPIRQTDYYRTASLFWAGYIGQESLGGPTAEQLGYDVFGWTDKGREADPLRLLIKGERLRPGDVVEPGFLSTVPALDEAFAPPPEGSPTTQRRLQFARWVTDPRNPLTARVFVNRLWLGHFGEGIVRTPNNFGFKGALPTHPQLLDWLAAEFVDGGWSIKRMHRLILTSATYRQASVHPKQAEYAAIDSANERWWRFDRRRLDAEAIRDAMLSISGRLNPQMHGPSFSPAMSEEALEGLSRKEAAWTTSSEEERSRRSVYMMTKRSRLLPLMTVFNFTDTTLPCGQRDVTTEPTQALALLNNEFVHEQSDVLAKRVEAEAGGDPQQQIDRAWQLAFGRPPTPEERSVALVHLESQAENFQASGGRQSPDGSSVIPVSAPNADVQHLALASLCHVLLNTNEFLYVD